MDDETHIKADTKQIHGLEFLSVRSAWRFRKVPKEKDRQFAKKYLSWQAICECGRYSKPFVTTGTISEQISLRALMANLEWIGTKRSLLM